VSGYVSARFVQCGKKLKLSSHSGSSGSKKYKQGYAGTYGWDWWHMCLAEVRSLKLGGQFCVGVFHGNVVPITMKMFSHLIHFITKF
jgi:hypothetical protein